MGISKSLWLILNVEALGPMPRRLSMRVSQVETGFVKGKQMYIQYKIGLM